VGILLYLAHAWITAFVAGGGTTIQQYIDLARNMEHERRPAITDVNTYKKRTQCGIRIRNPFITSS